MSGLCFSPFKPLRKYIQYIVAEFRALATEETPEGAVGLLATVDAPL